MSFKIFVSSTTQDLKTHREQVRDLITALGLTDIAMERWPVNPRPPLEQVDAALRESDVYVGIFAWRYGSPVDDGGLSYTEHEYRLACQEKKPRLLYLTDPHCPWIPSQMDIDRTAIERLRSSIEKSRDVMWGYFASDWDLARRLVASLSKLLIESAKYRALPPEEKALMEILRLTREDFVARTNQIESLDDPTSDGERRWFISNMQRCNVGRFYIERQRLQESVAGWFLASKTPFLFLVGPSGIGKTNFLIDLIDCIARKASPLAQRAALLLPMGQYDPARSFPENLRGFLHHHPGLSAEVTSDDVASLIKTGQLLLILDGLDEFARIHSAEQCAAVFAELTDYVDPQRSRFIVSCRDHIYRRLAGSGLFQDASHYSRVNVPFLSPDDVSKALRNRIVQGAEPILAAVLKPPLLGFASNPLLLEMMCRFRIDSWKRLLASQTKGQLYDLWFEEIIAGGADDRTILDDESIAETWAKVRKIATLMVKARKDVVSEAELAANGVPLESLQALTRERFGILVKETSDEWGFVHGSFREFALAKSIAAELVSREYDLLASEPHLDYVGAEPHRFLRDLFSRKESELYHLLEEALDSPAVGGEEWNDVVWNVFETVGNIGAASAERFVDLGLAILDPRRPSVANHKPSYRTQRNIIRCLERLHRSAPRPYCDWVMARKWPQEPDRDNFGALAIRGFHMRKPQPGYFPPISFLMSADTRDTGKQAEVSDCLLHLLEQMLVQPPSEGKTDVEINCTFALIRWLHRTHEDRAKELLPRLSAGSRGNLFHAFLRFEAPEIFLASSDLFQGMILSWCLIDQSMVSNDFVFRDVRFERYQPWRITVAPQALMDCTFA
jgi:hypothetical protein